MLPTSSILVVYSHVRVDHDPHASFLLLVRCEDQVLRNTFQIPMAHLALVILCCDLLGLLTTRISFNLNLLVATFCPLGLTSINAQASRISVECVFSRSIILKLQRLVRNFIWGAPLGGRAVAWSVLIRPIREG